MVDIVKVYRAYHGATTSVRVRQAPSPVYAGRQDPAKKEGDGDERHGPAADEAHHSPSHPPA